MIVFVDLIDRFIILLLRSIVALAGVIRVGRIDTCILGRDCLPIAILMRKRK